MADCKCIVDQKMYKYCPNCGEKHAPWKALYCSENCRDIYAVLEDFAFGRIDAFGAKSKLNNLDLSNKDNFRPGIAKNFAKVMEAVPTKALFEEPVVLVAEEPRFERFEKRKGKYNKPNLNEDLTATIEVDNNEE